MAAQANLTSNSAGDVLTASQAGITLDRGAYTDYTVRTGKISSMSNGTALTGSGGIITPDAVGGLDETTLTGKGPEDYIDPATGNADTRTSRADDAGTPDNQSAPTVTGQAGGSHDTGVVEAISQNLVRFDGQALKVAHVNGDTVKYICVVTDAGDLTGKYVS
jgi:hypothetical protein